MPTYIVTYDKDFRPATGILDQSLGGVFRRLAHNTGYQVLWDELHRLGGERITLSQWKVPYPGTARGLLDHLRNTGVIDANDRLLVNALTDHAAYNIIPAPGSVTKHSSVTGEWVSQYGLADAARALSRSFSLRNAGRLR